ncbi:MAG: transglycosylase SLT domain-containing protein [Rhodobiaceae bacterium]|nr:transglycosylase SLT domain-containing protein [Rhodobiaceae bacterium]
MRVFLPLVLSAGLTLSAGPVATAQAAPQSIGDLLARSETVPLPPRKPAETLPWLADAPANVAAPLQLVPSPTAPAEMPASAPVQAAVPRIAPSVEPSRDHSARKVSAASLTGAEMDAFKAALKAVSDDDMAAADSYKSRISDSVAQAAVEWEIVRKGPGAGGARRAQAFLTRHPGWPSRDTIRNNIEGLLFDSPDDPGRVVAYFKEEPPLSGEGEIAYARALLATGNTSEGMAWLRKAWYTRVFSSGDEKAIINAFSRQLSRKDHLARAEGMLYRERISSAERMAPYLSKGEVALINAASAVIRRKGNAKSALNAVPGDVRNEPAWLFFSVQQERRSDDPVAAARLMTKAPRNPDRLIDTHEWWVERRVLLRQLLDMGQTELAYRMAAEHSSIEDDDIIEAEWHAGWVALSYLKKPRDAMRHFDIMARHSENPISVARAYYWHGRAAAASGSSGQAKQDYARAAEHITTYYGQLAAHELGRNRIDLGRIERSSNAVDALEPLRAATLFEEAGRNDLAMSLIVGMSFYVNDGPSFARLAVRARELGAPHIAVNIAKRGMRAGFNITDEAYPLSVIPGHARNSSGTPPALVYAIARQESEFNSGAVSHAGARGLMQLMPGTAKSVSREVGLSYNQSRLVTDPDYNVALGSAYLAKRLGNFDGSYIMAAAAYNAGKGRVDQWIGQFGDPRTRQIDPIEWVERIPFTETRNYVMRVLENMQVYEARLSRNSAPLNLKADLYKGR